MMGIVVIGMIFVDIKGYPEAAFIPTGRNVGWVERLHGGVGRNVAEDIANCELRPTLVSLTDESGDGEDVLKKLRNHKVNTNYIRKTPDGLGTWLAVFDNNGDVAGSISKRPNMLPLVDLLDERGDEIFASADAAVLEVDLDKEIVKAVIELAQRHGTKLFALVSNMSIAVQRRDFLQKFDCFICNRQEAGMFFADGFEGDAPEKLAKALCGKIARANIPSMVVTLGGQGAVYADMQGTFGVCPARDVHVKDTTGAGDAFCAGVAIGMTYGKGLAQAVEIGTALAASVITSSENVCPRFLPQELGLDPEKFMTAMQP